MVCTGTGSAPMRAMTERRRRRIAQKEGGALMLFFGARAPARAAVFRAAAETARRISSTSTSRSRASKGSPKQYVQDRIRARGADVARLVRDGNAHIYICGLKGMEQGVDQAFRDVFQSEGADWDALLPELRAQGRYHVETY